MTTPSRETFLARVRQAVRQGNRAGSLVELPVRGNIGYQGAGPDPTARFRDELTAVGGHVTLVPDLDAACREVLQLVLTKNARQVVVGKSALLDDMRLREKLAELAIGVTHVDDLTAETSREPLFAADVGISGADYLVAETGSVVVQTRPDDARSVSLLPPVHIVVAGRSQLAADLFDLFARLPANSDIPSCVTLITGPSKTGDIELRLVTGVHGPGEVHVVLVADR